MASEQEISWTVQTHEHRERSVDWYWGLGVLALAGGGISLFFGNGLLAIILAIGALSIGMLVARGPREHTVRLGARGLTVDGTFYRFAAIRSFWVEHEVEQPHLFLSMTGLIPLNFSFPIESEARGTEVRNFLKRFVHEEEQGPHFGEHVAQLFGL